MNDNPTSLTPDKRSIGGVESVLVLSILQQWRSYEWTVQGFGFIRTKLANVGRIHIWDSRLATPLVSTAHTHPWPLRSRIISGELINQRFVVSEVEGELAPYVGLPYLHSRIKTGEGGGLIGEPNAVLLRSQPPEVYRAGCSYMQASEEIHRSVPQDGTVTLLERPQGPPLEEASVYWPAGTQWVSAEPRKVSEWELERTVSYALARWHAT